MGSPRILFAVPQGSGSEFDKSEAWASGFRGLPGEQRCVFRCKIGEEHRPPRLLLRPEANSPNVLQRFDFAFDQAPRAHERASKSKEGPLAKFKEPGHSFLFCLLTSTLWAQS